MADSTSKAARPDKAARSDRAARPDENRILWEANRLWPRLQATSQHGLAVGALQPIETIVEQIESGGVRFVVRILANLSRKEKARQQQGKTIPANPFLPYEPDLYVTDISPTHLCLLNKFNVVDHHFLIVTREYEPQENWLTLADFQALAQCLLAIDGLAFFNGGKVAGASQPHKHLQVVPYSDQLTEFPIETMMTAAKENKCKLSDEVQFLPFPFCHAALPFSFAGNFTSDFTGDALSVAHRLLVGYYQLLETVGITGSPWKGTQTAGYNFLCTRQWMMIVPRSQEKYAGISVNSLGFAGSLLVKNREALQQLTDVGPVNLLQQVGFSLAPER
ncbi:MAG: phosphorylase [Phormidesmis priestleyi]|uniref:Phosphorylase n=1 Tax=Phormidesmis priestleyi TaxID=268141 RepID=A0A2W5A2B9_9CYAN|nr:MAG: phosphorylase [Phormidesmis priestleyi]